MRIDFVRLHAGYKPPHWKAGTGDKWDAGYESTAYMLEWIDAKYGFGTVRNLNLTMRDREYEDRMFKELTGRKISSLWKDYKAFLEDGKKEEGDGVKKSLFG